MYVDEVPVWDRETGSYVDPGTGVVLPTWDQAVEELEEPAAVTRFGSQVDIKGIIAPSEDANRSIRYLTKYLMKDVAGTYIDPESPDPAYEMHIDRLHDEVRWLPCSPECANWLRYGVQPRHPGPGLSPGFCGSRAHDRENLGFGGRRVQVSRHWSGKTLAEHRADRAAVVREVLAEAGVEAPEVDRMSSRVTAVDGSPRFVWESASFAAADYPRLVLESVLQRRRWRREYETARQLVAARASP